MPQILNFSSYAWIQTKRIKTAERYIKLAELTAKQTDGSCLQKFELK